MKTGNMEVYRAKGCLTGGHDTPKLRAEELICKKRMRSKASWDRGVGTGQREVESILRVALTFICDQVAVVN